MRRKVARLSRLAQEGVAQRSRHLVEGDRSARLRGLPQAAQVLGVRALEQGIVQQLADPGDALQPGAAGLRVHGEAVLDGDDLGDRRRQGILRRPAAQGRGHGGHVGGGVGDDVGGVAAAVGRVHGADLLAPGVVLGVGRLQRAEAVLEAHLPGGQDDGGGHGEEPGGDHGPRQGEAAAAAGVRPPAAGAGVEAQQGPPLEERDQRRQDDDHGEEREEDADAGDEPELG